MRCKACNKQIEEATETIDSLTEGLCYRCFFRGCEVYTYEGDHPFTLKAALTGVTPPCRVEYE